jgi:MerR family redox-sensitive transcriptional activator SoxR
MVIQGEITIGEAAARIGIATSALRFYERVGLIVAARTEGGQRRYGRDVLRRVAFIRGAQSVGMKLTDIRAAIDHLPVDRSPTPEEWQELSDTWRPELDEKIATLIGLRDALSKCIGCGCQSLDGCAIFNPGDIAGESGPGAHFLASPRAAAPA